MVLAFAMLAVHLMFASTSGSLMHAAALMEFGLVLAWPQAGFAGWHCAGRHSLLLARQATA